MAEPIKATNEEVITTTANQVTCSGPDVSKHPRVTLTFKGGTDNEVVCPYCSCVFRKKS